MVSLTGFALRLLFGMVCVSFAKASCPAQCSGHGACGKSSVCSCYAGYDGPSCATKQCPSGLSWAAKSRSTSNFGVTSSHRSAVCSGHGFCNGISGDCICQKGFSGSACSISMSSLTRIVQALTLWFSCRCVSRPMQQEWKMLAND